MPATVSVCRIGNRAVRHLTADSLAELEALDGLHAGLPAYVIGTSEAYQWNGSAWVAGDRGIRAITSASSGGITLGTSYGGGALSAVLFRTLIILPNNVAYSPAPVVLPAPGIRVYPNSCIWVILRGTATAATVAGSYTIMER